MSMESRRQQVLREDHVHQTPNRSLWQLCRLNALQFGTAFCYSTETALVTPLLLSLGLPNQLFGIGWLLGPVLGCFLSPVIMVRSERCRSSWGRRRPFLLALGMGLIIGVVLYLNGSIIGVKISHPDQLDAQDTLASILVTMLGVVLVDFCCKAGDIPSKAYLADVCNQQDINKGINIRLVFGGFGGALGYAFVAIDWMSTSLGVALGSQLRVICLFNVAFYTLSLALTIFSIPEAPHQHGQQSHSTTQWTSPSPSSCSYCCGHASSDVDDAIRDDEQAHHVHDDENTRDNVGSNDMVNDAPFHIPENLDDEQQLLADGSGLVQPSLPPPERLLYRNKPSRRTIRDRNRRSFVPKQSTNTSKVFNISNHESSHLHFFPHSMHSEVEKDDDRGDPNGSLGYARVSAIGIVNGIESEVEYRTDGDRTTNDSNEAAVCPVTTLHDDVPTHRLVDGSSADAEDRLKSSSSNGPLTVKYLVRSAVFMPCILRRLMFCCNISWTAFLTMLLYFTDYMGQAVYRGDPGAPADSASLFRYDLGVKMGCWGLCIFSGSAAITGLILTRLDKYLSLRTIFVFGQLIYAIGCGAMLVTVPYPYVTISLCVTFGIEFAVITKIPASIIAIYHRSEQFTYPEGGIIRTMSSDLATLGGQVLFAQITVSTLLAPIVHSAGTRLALVVFASGMGFVSCVLSACFISYEI